jgi:eukaryotic-like serine/threonine-protein kinase
MTVLSTAEPSSRYRLLAKWASGGMADVYVARQQGAGGFDKIVALKFMREHGDNPSLREMFLQEVRTAALLNHPNIVQTFDAGQIAERLYMAMEFVNGEPLGRFARAVTANNAPFPVELAVAIARDLANALEYAHTLTDLDGVPLQLVHRDISPSNVMLSFDGQVKLLDFGLVKVATKIQSTKVGVIKGKFSYMSPEQARGEALDHRSDIYSLGIVLWHLLTGKAAFDSENDADLMQAVLDPRIPPPSKAGARCSEVLDAIVMDALAPARDQRYSTAGEFATALSRYLTRTAAGFDATKLIRALMGAHFKDRKERLAQLIKGSVTALPLDEISAVMNQPSIRTPTPPSSAHAPATHPIDPGSVQSTIARPVDPGSISSTVTPPLPAAPPPKRRNGWVILSLTVAAAALGVLANEKGWLGTRERETSPPGQAPVREDAQPAQIAAAPNADAQPEVRAPAVAPQADAQAHDVAPPTAIEPPVVAVPQPGSRTVQRPKDKRDLRPPAPTAVRRPSAPALASTPATDSGSALGSANPDRGGSAAMSATPSPAPDPVRPTAGSATPTPPPSPSPVTGPGSAVPPSPPPSAPKLTAGSFDAIPAITKVAVDGSLPTSEVESTIERTVGGLRECYRTAARRANTTPALTIKLSFQIDEGRTVRNVKISGDTLGLGPCAKDVFSNLRTRSAPDVGTVAVLAVVSFKPVSK